MVRSLFLYTFWLYFAYLKTESKLHVLFFRLSPTVEAQRLRKLLPPDNNYYSQLETL